MPTLFLRWSPELLYFFDFFPPRRVSFNLGAGTWTLSSLSGEGHHGHALPSTLILIQLKNTLGATLYLCSFPWSILNDWKVLVGIWSRKTFLILSFLFGIKNIIVHLNRLWVSGCSTFLFTSALVSYFLSAPLSCNTLPNRADSNQQHYNVMCINF